jgi:predicted AlkP superfamily phosphohydrolase/phosphomutase
MQIERNGTPGAVAVTIGRERRVLAVGETSDWVPLPFRAGLLRVHGLAQLHLMERDPELRLYMSPIHLNPEKPALPISHPRLFVDYLAKRVGGFGTLGLMEDTSALNADVLDEAGFLTQAWRLFEERKAMLLATLATGADDVTVCVFDTPDRIQHMFWHYREPDHPAAPGRQDPAFSQEIERMVMAMDELVGEVRARLAEDTLLIVLSDHGFTGFQRGVNLNSWLHQQGYLTLRPGTELGRDWLAGVDWSRTRAYALGLSGLYLNLRGREAQGIVAPGREAAALAAELKAGLEALIDEARGGRRPIRRAFVAAEVFQGPYRHEGPDVLMGYEAGYRCAWECANGQVTAAVLSDNTRRWSGDHCVDPALVPGVLAASGPLAAGSARLVDIAPTVLDMFGIAPAAPMQGRSLLPGGRPSEGVAGV